MCLPFSGLHSFGNRDTMTHSRRPVITYERNEYGGRLRYSRSVPVDAGYWDTIWMNTLSKIDFSVYEGGYLPRHIREAFHHVIKPHSRVLEAGCGLGEFTIAAHALGHEAHGVDYASHIVEALRERFPDIYFFQGDVTRLSSVENDYYDVVYSPGVCEHYEEGPEKVLAEARRVLKSGGTLITTAPCFNAFRRGIARIGAFHDEPARYFYQYAFSPQELTSTLQLIGFKVQHVRQYGTLGTLYQHLPLASRLPLEPVQSMLRLPIGADQKPLAVALDSIPGVRSWGHSGVWISQKI